MSDELHLRAFRDRMIREGLILIEGDIDEKDRNETKLRLKHLTAMAMLAHHTDETLAVDESLGPESLYAALGEIVPLNESVVFTLRELLEIVSTPGFSQEKHLSMQMDDRSKEEYTHTLRRALKEAKARFPWRNPDQREQFTNKKLIGEERKNWASNYSNE